MRTRAPWVGLLLAVTVLALTFTLPHLLDWDVHTRAPRSARDGVVPPLHGYWDPKWLGPGTVPALLLAVLGVAYAARVADRLPWRRLLLATYAVAAAWLFALALVDGEAGLSRVLGNPYEYLRSAREVEHIPSMLPDFIDRIPQDAEDDWPTHVAGHPPGALLFFVLLVRLGLGGDLAAGVVVTLVAASVPVAVLVMLRALDAEPMARRAAPFLVLGPAAIFLAVSADAVFTAVACWGMAALALACRADRPGSPGRRGSTGAVIGWAGVAGVLLGYGVFLSYGFGILGLVALAVLAAARSWRPLLMAVPAALAVVAVFAGCGFAWWEAYPVLVERYHDGIAADRPMTYWWWGNIGALLVSTGPLVGAGLATAIAGAPSPRRAPADDDTHGRRTVTLLAAAGIACVVAADVSGMSKSEVERIWLIFVPWLLVSCALLPDRWLRRGLALQVAFALVVQHLLYTSW